MSAVQIQGNASGTGTLTIAAPNTNTNQTLTLPDNTGTLLSTASTFAGTGPAFSTYLSANFSLSFNANTKVTFDTEDFDTNNNFASNRFTPTVAGYYQISVGFGLTAAQTSSLSLIVYIYKNGASVGQAIGTGAASFPGSAVSKLIYFNGSTDYVEAYAYTNVAAGVTIQGGSAFSFFTGAMIRAA